MFHNHEIIYNINRIYYKLSPLFPIPVLILLFIGTIIFILRIIYYAIQSFAYRIYTSKENVIKTGNSLNPFYRIKTVLQVELFS